jgi:hypothetical protein
MLAAADVNTGRIAMHYFQSFPIHFLAARPLLLCRYTLLAHSDTLQPSKVNLDSAGSDSRKEISPTGSDPRQKTKQRIAKPMPGIG